MLLNITKMTHYFIGDSWYSRESIYSWRALNINSLIYTSFRVTYNSDLDVG